MEDTGTVVAFYALSIMTVGSALAIVLVRNLIHAVVFLVLCFLGVAGLYITLSADFIGVVQILIYSGAISILMIFAIVLTPTSSRDNNETFMRLPAVVVAGCVAAMLGFVAIDTDWRIPSNLDIANRPGFDNTATAIGEALLKTYILPFEIAAALMLVAMLGAIILVRPEGVPEEAEE